MNEILFKEYSLFEMPAFWTTLPIFLLIGVLFCWFGSLGDLQRKPFKEASLKLKLGIIVYCFIIFGGFAFMAGCCGFMSAQSATQASAAEGLQKSIQETYGISITDDQAKKIAPSYEIINNLPEDEFLTWGPTTVRDNDEILEVTLANIDGDLKLVSGKETLTELPKRQK